jgi:hypothetical protein
LKQALPSRQYSQTPFGRRETQAKNKKQRLQNSLYAAF